MEVYDLGSFDMIQDEKDVGRSVDLPGRISNEELHRQEAWEEAPFTCGADGGGNREKGEMASCTKRSQNRFEKASLHDWTWFDFIQDPDVEDCRSFVTSAGGVSTFLL